MKDFSWAIPDLLHDNIPVLIYAGDVDFICNYLGNKAWTLNLNWKFKTEFNAQPDQSWNDKKGSLRKFGPFSFLQIYDAGHMVPHDQPKVSLDMVDWFFTQTITSSPTSSSDSISIS